MTQPVRVHGAKYNVQWTGTAVLAVDKFNVEAGAGLGYWRGDNDDASRGFGLILGTGYSILNPGKHNLQVGIQYAPAFTDPGTVHNFGFTFGYQFQ